MPALPGSLALTNIADGAAIVAADHRNNYAAIQTAMNAMIALFSNGSVDGEALVWDVANTKWVNASSLPAGRPRPPRVVTSTMAGGPPSSPADQDIWIATAVDANGVRWAFQYNAGSASPNKWEFIGGPPAFADVATSEISVVLSTWLDLATVGPQVTLARAGDYETIYGCEMWANAAGAQQMGISIGGAAPADSMANSTQVTAGGMPNVRQHKFSAAAGQVVKAQYLNTAGTGRWQNRFVRVLPVRVA